MTLDATKLIDAGSVCVPDNPRWFRVVYTGNPEWGLQVGDEVRVGCGQLRSRDGGIFPIKDPGYDQYPILYPVEE